MSTLQLGNDEVRFTSYCSMGEGLGTGDSNQVRFFTSTTLLFVQLSFIWPTSLEAGREQKQASVGGAGLGNIFVV